MKRGVSLQSLIAKAREAEAASEARGEPKATTNAAPEATAVPAAKVGVPLGFLVSDEDRQRVKHIAVTERMSVQEILHAALSQWLQAKGHPGLEPQTANRPSGRKR